MKKNFDELKLADASLADEGWQAYRDQLCNNGLAVLRTKRLRRRWGSVAQIAAMLVLFGGVLWSIDGRKKPENSWRAGQSNGGANSLRADLRSNVPRTEAASRPQKDGLPYVTEEEMLAMFPKGSCVVAEVNGQKELVFLDQRSAREGFHLTE